MYIMKNGVIRKYEPTPSDVHVNAPLTNISIAFQQNPAGFVADRVFQIVPVDKKSDVYFNYDRGYFLTNNMQVRGVGTESAGSGYAIDANSSYVCVNYALHKDIPDEVRANSDSMLNPDRESTIFINQKALINREVNWATSFFTSGVWTNDYTGLPGGGGFGSNQFKQWDQANSTPIEDIRYGMTVVGQSTGFRPNVLTVGRQVWDKLADHAEIIDRVKYGQTGSSSSTPAMVTRQAVASILELDEINVMDGIYNSAKEGQTATYAFIGGKNALLSYRPPAPGLMTPAAGYTFAWTGYMGAGPLGQRITKFRMENLKSDRVEIEQYYVQKKISADLGAMYNSAIG